MKTKIAYSLSGAPLRRQLTQKAALAARRVEEAHDAVVSVQDLVDDLVVVPADHQEPEFEAQPAIEAPASVTHMVVTNEQGQVIRHGTVVGNVLASPRHSRPASPRPEGCVCELVGTVAYRYFLIRRSRWRFAITRRRRNGYWIWVPDES